jgi:polysaccharide export outer membrane protein
MKNGCQVCLACLLVICCYTNLLAAEGKYLIGPGDVLEISVWRDESLSREVTVPPDGIIAFPLIGDLDVNSITVAELRDRVTQKLSEFIPDATVTVILRQINSLKGYVIGKVKSPGAYAIQMDTTVLQILSMAGGLTPYASESNIHIHRRTGEKMVRMAFDYKEIVKGKKLNQDIILKRGDVIVVP